MKKKILSKIFSYILALFLAVTMFAGVVCDIIYKNVCNPEVILSTAASSGYTTQLYEEIAYKWENLLSVTGISDVEPFIQVLTLEKVENAAYSYLCNSYTGTAEVETQNLSTDLKSRVLEYAENNNIYETSQEELNTNADNLVSACMTEFKNSIRIPLLPKMLSATGKLAPVLKVGPIVCAAFFALLSVFLFFLQRNRTDVLYYSITSTITNAVLLLGISWAAIHYRAAERLPVDISALRTLAVTYLNHLFDRLRTYGYGLLILAAALLLLYIAVILVKLLRKKTIVCDEGLSVNNVE